MNALKRWNQFKDLEAFRRGLDSLPGGSSIHRPERREEPLSAVEWSPLVNICEDEKSKPQQVEVKVS